MKMINIQEEAEEKPENKIVDWIAASAGGQLTIMGLPEGSVADFEVKLRGEYSGISAVYLQIRKCEKDAEEKVYRAEITDREFELKDNFYLIFLYFDIVVQDVMEYIWLIPAVVFSEIADIIYSKKNKKVFKFETPFDIKKENKYSKYLVRRKNLAKTLVRIIKKRGKFVFPEDTFSGLAEVKLDELKKFIVEARENTFAGVGIFIDNPRLKGSKELGYQKGNFIYQDIYFDGEKNFIGQEIVYYNNKPVWGMGYLGDQTPDEITEFLKKALSGLSEKCRFGENCGIERKELHYKDNGIGGITKFSGQETISFKEKNIYKLNYQGGLLI